MFYSFLTCFRDDIVSLASPESRRTKSRARRRSMVLERDNSIEGNETYDSLEGIFTLMSSLEIEWF